MITAPPCLVLPCLAFAVVPDVFVKRTKIQGSPPEKRLSLLYALHELFRRASKDLERDFDYAAWEDAVRAVVPWAFRKQNEADKLKINKSVRGGGAEERERRTKRRK